MKPVVIIAIAVVCSVVAVLGVLFAIITYEEYQYQQAVELQYFENVVSVKVAEKIIDDIRSCFKNGGYRDCLTMGQANYPLAFDKAADEYGVDSSNYKQYKADMNKQLAVVYFDSLCKWQNLDYETFCS